MQVAFVSLLLAALTSQAFAILFMTSPTATTSAQGGQVLTIAWMDNGTAPLLSDIGPCEFGVYAGNMQQQTEVQQIAPSVDVSKQNTLNFTIDSNSGPNFSGYFIRVTSNGLKDPNSPQNPYEAFSAKFTIGNMSGQFSSSVQAQINGVTSASSGAAATPAPVSSSVSAPKISTTILSGTILPASVTSASSSAPKSTQSSSAVSTTRGNVGLLSAIGIVVYGLVGLTL